MDDNIKVTLVDVHGTDAQIADRARTTVSLESGDIHRTIKPTYMRKLYLSEHSPIRIKSFIVKVENIPSWIATHLVRHSVGYTPFVSTQRDDRNPGITNRDEEKQGNLVCLDIHLNTQSVINVSRKRLCHCAHPRTRNVWEKILKVIEEVDEPLVQASVKECVYRGHCFEVKSCGFYKTAEFFRELDAYRGGSGND